MSLLLREELRCSNHKEADENPREEVGNLKKVLYFLRCNSNIILVAFWRVLLLAHSSTPRSHFLSMPDSLQKSH